MLMTARYHVLHCLTAPQAFTSAPRCVLLTCSCAGWWADVLDPAGGLLCRHAQPGLHSQTRSAALSAGPSAAMLCGEVAGQQTSGPLPTCCQTQACAATDMGLRPFVLKKKPGGMR